MTIEEAIQHCRETARGLRNRGETLAAMNQDGTDCAECAAEHEQLAEWLEELRVKRCKVIVQANRINDLEAEVNAELAKRAKAYEKLWSAYAKIDEQVRKAEEAKQESPQKACTTCGKRTRCPGPGSGRPQTGCSFWSEAEEGGEQE